MQLAQLWIRRTESVHGGVGLDGLVRVLDLESGSARDQKVADGLSAVAEPHPGDALYRRSSSRFR